MYLCVLLQVQSLFYRNIATPLFEEWQRCLNTSLSASMMSNLSSNQARWDLICQQEHLMAESIVSTSSSSGGGGSSFQCESRRDSLEPPLQSNYRLSSRSSLGNEETSEGDCEDSEPCSPYPYMPLDSVEMAPEALQASWQRRHSLPPHAPLLPIGILDKADPIAIKQMEANLQQQLSLIEKRRSVQELRRQNNELLANLKLNKRRRIFKGCRSLTTESAEGPKVTFHFLDEDSLPVKDARRGSAPSTLLLNQINKIANTAAKAAMAGSREASPRGSGACQPSWHGLRNRRSSLPLTDSMNPADFQATDKSRSLSREKVIKKRKLLRRRSAGSGDDYYPMASSGCSKRMIHHHRMTNPNSSSSSAAAACLAFRRGSLKSSSFGGVGSTLPASSGSSVKLLKKSNLLRNWQEEEQQQLHIHSNNGRRRGSLPLELILC